MVTFEVDDMTCGHCVSTITKAVRSVDPSARVQADLSTHRVQIEATVADVNALSAVIKEAGYTPVAVTDGSEQASGAPPRGGCCCG